VIDEEHIYDKGKNPLSFENWIFRNGQPVRVDDRISIVAMTST